MMTQNADKKREQVQFLCMDEIEKYVTNVITVNKPAIIEFRLI